MIKKILNRIVEFFVIGSLTFILILDIVTIINIKREISYISEGLSIIGYSINNINTNTENIEKEIKTILIKNDELKDTIIKLMEDKVSKNELLEKTDSLKKELGQQTKDKISIEIDSLKNEIEEQRLTDEIKEDSNIEQKINKDKENTQKLENKFRDINVMIFNNTGAWQGSGSFVLYKNHYYILSAGHLVEDEKDLLYLKEKGEIICKLKLVKLDKERDIALFKPENPNYIPIAYTELAEIESTQGSEIYVVGNPLGIDDVISKGRIIKYGGFYCYFQDHSYFGASGGGIYTLEGKLIGIISIIIANSVGIFPPFVTNGAIRLNQIIQFMGDIN